MGAGDAANVYSSLLVRLVRKAGVPLRQLRAVAQNLAIVHLLERSRNFDCSGRLAGLGGALRGGRWRHHAARASRPNCCRRTGPECQCRPADSALWTSSARPGQFNYQAYQSGQKMDAGSVLGPARGCEHAWSGQKGLASRASCSPSLPAVFVGQCATKNDQ